MVDAIPQGTSGFKALEKDKAKRNGAPPAQTLGAVLRQRREAMGVTLAEVEVATRIRQKYLAAIEADDWHLLPGEVVGRGFLRNYSDYLGLESHDVVDRRRAVTDPGLVAALATTSSGTVLPPERKVDYRPKELELKDEADGIQRGEIRLTPILYIVALALIVVVGWWGITRMRTPLSRAFTGVQSQFERVTARNVPTVTPELIGIVNSQNTDSGAGASGNDGAVDLPSGGGSGVEAPAVALLALEQSATPTEPAPTSVPPTATLTEEPPEPAVVLPTATPAVALPTPTLLPTNTSLPPTPEPEAPVETPTPEPPAVAAAICADGRAAIISPGMNQVVSGVMPIMGSASHEALDYYKLEFASGANASEGFVYFDGKSIPVSGGQLGAIDTRALANGAYTLRVTVVDQSGNFPEPCLVSIIVQN